MCYVLLAWGRSNIIFSNITKNTKSQNVIYHNPSLEPCLNPTQLVLVGCYFSTFTSNQCIEIIKRSLYLWVKISYYNRISSCPKENKFFPPLIEAMCEVLSSDICIKRNFCVILDCHIRRKKFPSFILTCPSSAQLFLFSIFVCPTINHQNMPYLSSKSSLSRFNCKFNMFDVHLY